MGNWNNLSEEELERFIKANKDKLNIYRPTRNHEEHFLIKLAKKFKRIISIVPYLIRVAIVTVFIFAFSVWIWNSYIRWDRRWIALPQKIENTYHRIFHDTK